jgi:hypothetical protein
MSDKKNSSIGIGIAFVIAGLFLMAYRFGYIDFNIFWSLVNLWPLILVAIGVSIIFRRNPWIKGLVWILLIVAVVLYGYYGEGKMFFFGHQVIDYDLTETITELKLEDETKSGKIVMNLGAGAINIGSTDDYTAVARYPDEITDISTEFSNGGKDFELRMNHNDKYLPRPRVNMNGFTYDLELQENVIWDIDIDMGAMDMEMDLRDLDFNKLDLDLGAGDIDIYLGNPAEKSNISIDSGVSDIKVFIPEDVPVKIRFDGGIKDIDFTGDSSFNKNGDYYESDNFTGSAPYYYLDISTGVGELTIEQY